jgi:hypothetical protein
MMLSLTLLLWEKEWEAACLLVLYSFICNDGFISDKPKLVLHHYFEVIPSLRQHVWLLKLPDIIDAQRFRKKKAV